MANRTPDEKRVIVPLDFPGADAALEFAARLDPKLCRLKVGKELFVAAGPAVVERLQERGFEVFLDLKFHDIPNTVAGACRSAARLGVWMMTLHASGGQEMMRAAHEAVAGAPSPPLLVAVTILTSLSDADMQQLGFGSSVQETVVRLATLASTSGMDGVVCSAHEARELRSALGPRFVLVTPGIRLPNAAKDNQSRVMTPVEAVGRGADYLVIGRPITQAENPVAVLESIRSSLHESAPA